MSASVMKQPPKKDADETAKKFMSEALDNSNERALTVINNDIGFIKNTLLPSLRSKAKAVGGEEQTPIVNQIGAATNLLASLTNLKDKLGSEDFGDLTPEDKMRLIMGLSIAANKINVIAHEFEWRDRLLDAAREASGGDANAKIEIKAYINAALLESEEALNALKEQKKSDIRGKGVDKAKKMDKSIDKAMRERELVIDSLTAFKKQLDGEAKTITEGQLNVMLAMDTLASSSYAHYCKSKIPFDWDGLAADAAALIATIDPLTAPLGIAYFTLTGGTTIFGDIAMNGRMTWGSAGGVAMIAAPFFGDMAGILREIQGLEIAGKASNLLAKGAGYYLMVGMGKGTLDTIINASQTGWTAADIQGVLENGIFAGFGFVCKGEGGEQKGYEDAGLKAGVYKVEFPKAVKWVKGKLGEEKGYLDIGEGEKRVPEEEKPPLEGTTPEKIMAEEIKPEYELRNMKGLLEKSGKFIVCKEESGQGTIKLAFYSANVTGNYPNHEDIASTNGIPKENVLGGGLLVQFGDGVLHVSGSSGKFGPIPENVAKEFAQRLFEYAKSQGNDLKSVEVSVDPCEKSLREWLKLENKTPELREARLEVAKGAESKPKKVVKWIGGKLGEDAGFLDVGIGKREKVRLAPAISKFLEKIPVKKEALSMKTIGGERILIEREENPSEAAVYVKRYNELVFNIAGILKDDYKSDIAKGKSTEENFITAVWGIINSNLEIRYGTNRF